VGHAALVLFRGGRAAGIFGNHQDKVQTQQTSLTVETPDR
jgi:hypothetical protein